jgi:hypothetical protein
VLLAMEERGEVERVRDALGNPVLSPAGDFVWRMTELCREIALEHDLQDLERLPPLTRQARNKPKKAN